MSGPFFEMTHITGCAREARDHCEYPAWARGSLTVLQCPDSGCHRTNRSQQPPPVSHETLSIHPPAHVTCVNMDTCHRGLEHLVSALWWAFCDLPMMAGLMHPELEPSCGDSECLIAGVTVPLLATWALATPCTAQMMPARALTFNTGNLGWCGLSSLWLLRLSVSPQLCQDHRGGNISHVRADTGPGRISWSSNMCAFNHLKLNNL